MRKIVMVALLVLGMTSVAYAYDRYGYGTGSNPYSDSVSGYLRSDGNYVGGYQRTMPNQTDLDNYGTRGTSILTLEASGLDPRGDGSGETLITLLAF